MNDEILLKILSEIDLNLAEATEFLADDPNHINWAMYYLGIVQQQLNQLKEYVVDKKIDPQRDYK